MFIEMGFFPMKMNIPNTKYSIYIHMNAFELNLNSVNIFFGYKQSENDFMARYFNQRAK